MEPLITTLDMTGECVYSIDEVVEWCVEEYGIQTHFWNYYETESNRYQFQFTSTRDLVRFGLTWNTSTIKHRPRQNH